MPPDPNARRDKALEAILGEVRKTNSLLTAQNKVLEKMEKYGRPPKFTLDQYLESQHGEPQSGASDQEGSSSTDGGFQGGNSAPSGSSLGSRR